MRPLEEVERDPLKMRNENVTKISEKILRPRNRLMKQKQSTVSS